MNEIRNLSEKTILPTFLLFLVLSWPLGAHRFFLKRYASAILFIITIGGFGIWWIIDFILIVTGSMKDDEGKLVETKTTDGNGVVTFSNVPYGDYTIKNLSGPKGYNSSSDTLSVSVSEETEYSAGSFVNVKIVVAATVRTGDNITYYIIALVVALLVLGFVIVLIFASKRRKKTKTKWRK